MKKPPFEIEFEPDDKYHLDLFELCCIMLGSFALGVLYTTIALGY